MENMGEKNITVEQLHCKEVINILDGKRLGYPCDIKMDLCDGRVLAIIVPCGSGFMGFGAKQDDYVIPWDCIEKIGKDIILVRWISQNKCQCQHQDQEKKKKLFTW